MRKKVLSPPVIWSAILVIAAVFYLLGISHEDLWFDEVYSAMMAEHNVLGIISLTPYDVHPPLYYLLLRPIRLILGNSEWALRLLSVVAAVALIGLGAGPVRRIFRNRVAYIYSAVVLFTPIILIYAHEARMYTLVMFTVTVSALYGYLAVQGNQKRDWALFGLSSLASAYLHYYGLIDIFYINLFVFIWLVIQKREHLKSFFVTVGCVVAGYLPWLLLFLKQTMDVNRAFWIPTISIQTVAEAFSFPFAYKEFYPDMPPTASIVTLIALALIMFGAVFALVKKVRPELTVILFCLLVFLSTLLTGIIVSLTLAPVFIPRYMLACLGLFLLALSLGINLLPGKYLQLAAVGIFALLNVFVIADVYTQRFNGPMQEIVQDLEDSVQPGDLVISTFSLAAGPSLYYFPEATHYYYLHNIESQWQHMFKIFEPGLIYHQNPQEILAEHQSFWLINLEGGLSTSAGQILQGATGWEQVVETKKYVLPYSPYAFSVAKYAHTDNENTAQSYGNLRVKITGLKPIGHLHFVLHDRGPISPTSQLYWFDDAEVTGEEYSYTFAGLEYGEYVLVVAHDENGNHIHDFDDTGWPIEGVYVLNADSLENLNFDNLKFSFDQPEMEIEAQMVYPPLIGQE